MESSSTEFKESAQRGAGIVPERKIQAIEARLEQSSPEVRTTRTGFYKAQFLKGDVSGIADTIKDYRSPERLQLELDKLSKDTSIGKTEMVTAATRMVNAVTEEATAVTEDIKRGYTGATNTLKKESNPYSSKEARAARADFAAAKSIMGGTGKMSHGDVVQEIQDAIVNENEGALSFYSEHAGQILNSYKDASAGEKFEHKGILQDLETATAARMNPTQRTAHDSLKKLDFEWDAADLESVVETSKYFVDGNGQLFTAKNLTPRQRTAQEEDTAQANYLLRRVANSG